MVRFVVITVLVGGLCSCVEADKDPCDDINCPAHSTCIVDNGHTECVCDMDTIREGEECINSQLVDCMDVAPA